MVFTQKTVISVFYAQKGVSKTKINHSMTDQHFQDKIGMAICVSIWDIKLLLVLNKFCINNYCVSRRLIDYLKIEYKHID